VLAAGYAALGNGRTSAEQTAAPRVAPVAQAQQSSAPHAAPVVQAQPTAEPTEEPKKGPDTDNIEQQDGPQNSADQPDATEQPDNEAADAAALASKATVTVEQAKATALAANPGTTAVKAELGDEDGTIVYSVELSNGADVKVDARSGKIVRTDQAESDSHDEQGDTEAPEKP
jgi:uncharacterized membrane protein YkoI